MAGAQPERPGDTLSLSGCPLRACSGEWSGARCGRFVKAVGVREDGKRTVLGVSVALSEQEVHWRTFLQSLAQRGLRGVELIISDDYAGLRAARGVWRHSVAALPVPPAAKRPGSGS
ncbi:MAG TPA: hypothetical protein ENJ54_03640 [Chloroflexi bacterium]|nr:hypothetical protein [Chloroflexota bacterium]